VTGLKLELEEIVAEKTETLEENSALNKNYYTNQYLDLLAENLIVPSAKTNSCQASYAENSNYVPIDERIIIEAKCSGILNIFFVMVPDDMISELKKDDLVIVQCEEATEIATVKEVGNYIKAKRQRLGLYGEHLPRILKKAEEEDLVTLKRNSADEERAKESFRSKALKYNLQMKLVRVHYQFDRNKLFFFYTADGRIDFRELAKDLAGEFRTRIELRQIGVRDEAKKIGGIGTCGREFCCSSFLGNFKRISTHLAAEQNNVSNFSKLSGPCCKLKCCLSFELEKMFEEISNTK